MFTHLLELWSKHLSHYPRDCSIFGTKWHCHSSKVALITKSTYLELCICSLCTSILYTIKQSCLKCLTTLDSLVPCLGTMLLKLASKTSQKAITCELVLQITQALKNLFLYIESLLCNLGHDFCKPETPSNSLARNFTQTPLLCRFWPWTCIFYFPRAFLGFSLPKAPTHKI